MKARQHDIVQGRITDGTLFPNISARMMDDINSLLERAFAKLKQKMKGVLLHIRLDLTCSLPDAARARLTERERQLRDQLAQEVKKLQRRHRQLLDNIAHIE